MQCAAAVKATVAHIISVTVKAAENESVELISRNKCAPIVALKKSGCRYVVTSAEYKRIYMRAYRAKTKVEKKQTQIVIAKQKVNVLRLQKNRASVQVYRHAGNRALQAQTKADDRQRELQFRIQRLENK